MVKKVVKVYYAVRILPCARNGNRKVFRVIQGWSNVEAEIKGVAQSHNKGFPSGQRSQAEQQVQEWEAEFNANQETEDKFRNHEVEGQIQNDGNYKSNPRYRPQPTAARPREHEDRPRDEGPAPASAAMVPPKKQNLKTKQTEGKQTNANEAGEPKGSKWGPPAGTPTRTQKTYGGSDPTKLPKPKRTRFRDAEETLASPEPKRSTGTDHSEMDEDITAQCPSPTPSPAASTFRASSRAKKGVDRFTDYRQEYRSVPDMQRRRSYGKGTRAENRSKRAGSPLKMGDVMTVSK